MREKMFVKKILYLFLAIVFVCLLGCSGSAGVQKAISLNITPDQRVNQGRPFYIAVLPTNKRDFLITGYDDISSKVMHQSKDKRLLAFQVIFPGRKDKIVLYANKNVSLGVYALFTHPSDQWKILLLKPLKENYDITLRDEKVVLSKKSTHWWDIF